jgi:hypothetical protein
MPSPQSGESSETMDVSQDYSQISNFDLTAVDLQGSAYLVKGTDTAKITMAYTGSPQGQTIPQMNGAIKEDLQYLDQADGTQSTLSASKTSDGNKLVESYTVDGVTVTEKEYMAEREKFANSMMRPNANAQEQDSAHQ